MSHSEESSESVEGFRENRIISFGINKKDMIPVMPSIKMYNKKGDELNDSRSSISVSD